MVKIDQPSVLLDDIISGSSVSTRNQNGIREAAMTFWRESYMAALLETDWTRMHERLQAAEEEIRERQRVLSEDHGGTAEERQAIVDAINGLKMVENDVADWQKRQPPSGSKMQPD